MSVNYTAILAIGREFDDSHEASQFLVDNNLATVEEIEEEGVGEWLDNNDKGIEGGVLNYYTGYGCYIGFDISCRSPESFAKDFAEGMEQWNKLFPNTYAEVVHTVCVS